MALPIPASSSPDRRRLEHWLAEAREKATLLRYEGHALQAGSIERTVDELCAVPLVAELLQVMTEAEAALYTGRTAETLRSWFPSLEARGLAWQEGRTRYYRRAALEHRGNAAAAHAAGRRAARGER